MNREIITSLQNAFVKKAVALREAGQRKESGLMLIDGVREIERAYEVGIVMEHVFVCSALVKDRQILDVLKKHQTKIFEVTEAVFSKITFGQRLEGVLATARIPQKTLAGLKLTKRSLFVVVENLEKPGNIGAILRTCDAAGVHGLIMTDQKVDLYNPNVIRASTGCVFTVPAAIAGKQEVADFLKVNKIQSYGLFPESRTKYTDVNLTGPIALVVGSEDQGLSEFWAQHTQKITIPMKGQADSLNVSVCAAIVIYEALRQRK